MSPVNIARSSNGRTEAFEAFNLGSNPSRASKKSPQVNLYPVCEVRTSTIFVKMKINEVSKN
jgi:hypothetical protein